VVQQQLGSPRLLVPSKIIGFETQHLRIELAKKMGAGYIFNPRELPEEGSTLAGGSWK